MEPNIDVRPAATDDMSSLERVLGVEDVRFYRRQLHQPGVVLVAWLGDESVGALHVSWAGADEPEVRKHLPDVPIMHRLRIRADSRGRKLGSRLLALTEEYARQRGHDQLAAGIATGTGVDPTAEARVVRFYLRNGYREWDHGIVATVDEAHPSDDEVVESPAACRIYVKTLD
jgi:GNAT superfamily N-acetyltransferase